MLGTIEQEKLEAGSRDDAFLAHLDHVSDNFESYLRSESSWFQRFCRDKEPAYELRPNWARQMHFSPDHMDRYFGAYSRQLGLSMPDFLALGRSTSDAESDFCMTVLALRLSSNCNGVSELQGDVSRRMWQRLWPEVSADEIPIRPSPTACISAAGFLTR